jgi:hypothetical protein
MMDEREWQWRIKTCRAEVKFIHEFMEKREITSY